RLVGSDSLHEYTLDLVCEWYGAPPAPHSFPTRRSSDLALEVGDPALAGDQRDCAGELSFLDLAPESGSDAVEPLSGETDLHGPGDRKSTRLNSSHVASSYAVFCRKKKSIEVTNAEP